MFPIVKKGNGEKGDAFFILLFCFGVWICCCFILLYDLIDVLRFFEERKQRKENVNTTRKSIRAGVAMVVAEKMMIGCWVDLGQNEKGKNQETCLWCLSTSCKTF